METYALLIASSLNAGTVLAIAALSLLLLPARPPPPPRSQGDGNRPTDHVMADPPLNVLRMRLHHVDHVQRSALVDPH